MRNNTPPLEITNRMIAYALEIAELFEKLNVTDVLSSKPTLCLETESLYMGR